MLARRFSPNGELSYTTLVVGSAGVEAIYLATGQRTWLGQLRGTEVKPKYGRRVFEEGELQEMFSLFGTSARSFEPSALRKLKLNSFRDVSVRHAVSMRDFDPERQRDLVSIASMWLRGLFS
jgi:hypothetical protein